VEHLCWIHHARSRFVSPSQSLAFLPSWLNKLSLPFLPIFSTPLLYPSSCSNPLLSLCRRYHHSRRLPRTLSPSRLLPRHSSLPLETYPPLLPFPQTLLPHQPTGLYWRASDDDRSYAYVQGCPAGVVVSESCLWFVPPSLPLWSDFSELETRNETEFISASATVLVGTVSLVAYLRGEWTELWAWSDADEEEEEQKLKEEKRQRKKQAKEAEAVEEKEDGGSLGVEDGDMIDEVIQRVDDGDKEKEGRGENGLRSRSSGR
jgi:hypothetical protein